MTATTRRLLTSFLLLLPLSPVRAQKIWYEAARPDSFASYGLDTLVTDAGDTVLVDFYRSFAPLGDTITTRRQALVSWAGLSAFAKVHRHDRAAILYVWLTDPSAPLSPDNIAAAWALSFAKDRNGCWHLVNDTTPVSSCVARDDPRGPGAESPHPPPVD